MPLRPTPHLRSRVAVVGALCCSLPKSNCRSASTSPLPFLHCQRALRLLFVVSCKCEREEGNKRRGTTALRLGAPPTVLDSNVAIFGAGPTQTVRSCTEKRPSSRPLLLPNRPLSAVYMPYLLSYCARAAVAPRSCRCWPSLALACAALVSCAMGHAEWLCCCCICCATEATAKNAEDEEWQWEDTKVVYVHATAPRESSWRHYEWFDMAEVRGIWSKITHGEWNGSANL